MSCTTKIQNRLCAQFCIDFKSILRFLSISGNNFYNTLEIKINADNGITISQRRQSYVKYNSTDDHVNGNIIFASKMLEEDTYAAKENSSRTFKCTSQNKAQRIGNNS